MPFYVILNVFVKLKSNYFLLKVKSHRGMLRLTGVRRISITYSRLIQRERIDKTPEKQKPKPRFQSVPELAAYEVQNRELGTSTDKLARKSKIAPQCPWCKTTKVGGFNAIICSVWPGHNVLEQHTEHLGANEDEWRGIDLDREPVDVFDMDRYLNEKAYLAAKDPFRMTTPVSDKIDKWRAKYGTKP